MRTSTSDRSLDWIVVSIRWAFLVGFGIWAYLYYHGLPSVPIMVGFGVAASINIFATTMAGLKYRSRAYRTTTVAADVLFACGMLYLNKETLVEISPGWIVLLPVISASLYYQLVGIILTLVVNVAFLNWLAQTFYPVPDLTNGTITVLALLSLIAGAVFVFLKYLLVKGVPQNVSQSFPQSFPKKGSPSKKKKVKSAESLERDRRRAIYNMITELSSSLNYQRVLEAALDLSANTLTQLGAPADRLRSVALFFAENLDKQTELQVSTSRKLVASDARLTLPGKSGVIAHVIDNGQSALTDDLSNDPELSRFLGFHDCQTAYCIPLRSGLDTYGILVFAHPDVNFFVSENSEVLDIVGNQSVVALQNARLYQDLAQEKERMMEIQEESRKKLARDLHDGPTQSLAAIAMRVNFARRLMERDTKAAAEELYKIEDLARRTTKEIRHMLFTLRPLVLESQGLVAALESMAEKTRETYNQNVIIQADQRVVEALEMGKQAVVFYIAEEAVNNARKHAQAPHIWVRLKMIKEGLSLLEIEDDGVGFNVGAVDASYENRGSLGMVNMRERTDLVNGVLRIDSAPGRGTRVQVVIPLTEEAADRIRRGG